MTHDKGMRLITWITVGLLLALTSSAGAQFATLPPAGEDFADSEAVIVVTINDPPINIQNLQIGPGNLRGPTCIRRGNPSSGFPQVVDTQLFKLRLGGTLPGGITVEVQEHPTLASKGQIRLEQPNQPAKSFFDVFHVLVVKGPFGERRYANTSAIRVEATINKIPPIDEDYKGGKVQLFRQDGTGPVGTIEVIRHTLKSRLPSCPVVPTATQWGLIALGLLLAGSLAWMIRRRAAIRPAGA